METNPITEARHALSDLLEDSGNCRPRLHLLGDSFVSEQQKLRHVLGWAHSFLSSGSEVHHDFCRADSLILANEEQRETQYSSPSYQRSFAANCSQASCAVGNNEGPEAEGGMKKLWYTEPSNFMRRELKDQPCSHKTSFTDDLCILLSVTSGQDDSSRTRGAYRPNQKQDVNISDKKPKQTLTSGGPTRSSKELSWSSASRKNNTLSGIASHLKLLFKSNETADLVSETVGAHSDRDKSGHRMKEAGLEEETQTKNMVEEGNAEDDHMWKTEGKKKHESSSIFDIYAKDNKSYSDPEGTLKPTANESSTCHLKVPTNLTVYEKYQLYVDHLHHFKLKQTHTPTNLTPNNERFSAIVDKHQDRSTYSRKGTTLDKHGRRKTCHYLKTTVKETLGSFCCSQVKTVTGSHYLDLDSNKSGESTKGTAGGEKTTEMVRNTSVDDVTPVEKSAELTTKTGLLPKSHEGGVKGQKKQAEGRGSSSRLCEKSRVSLSSLTHGKLLPRPQSPGRIKSAKRLNGKTHSPEDGVKHTSACKDRHTCLPPAETHTRRPTSVHVDVDNTDYKDSSAGLSICDRWLRLPDEVWLSILSLLPHGDLCRVASVCLRLHTLSTDHTLWKHVRIENSCLTDWWLMCVSRRHPHSLCLYSCSGLSVTSSGLEMFFFLCRNSLQELKVTSCTGSGLHGDLMLPLIGQLCDHVCSLDVSWSGTTDAGVKALSDGRARLRLKAVVLNGCHVTDDPLMKLVMRHKERLEIFGCQFITPSCLQTVYEVCPDLQHLNIGQVPKVNAQSLTVLTSLLKNLISLNLTGLQAVTDATVDTLVQNCAGLQGLTLSSCPGVTDLTLQSISKHTPCIRSLDVSGCTAVTDAGVQSLALGCRSLQQLDLSSTATGNRGVNLLANYCSRRLRTVKLSFCRVSSESVLKLCRHCQRLKLLHLYSCARVPTQRQIRQVNATVKVHPLQSFTPKSNGMK